MSFFDSFPRSEKAPPRPKVEWWRGASLVILAPLALLILYAAIRLLVVLVQL